MANVTSYRLESTSTTDVSMGYSNRRTRNVSSVAGVVLDAASTEVQRVDDGVRHHGSAVAAS
jgi:hypothetical protein